MNKLQNIELLERQQNYCEFQMHLMSNTIKSFDGTTPKHVVDKYNLLQGEAHKSIEKRVLVLLGSNSFDDVIGSLSSSSEFREDISLNSFHHLMLNNCFWLFQDESGNLIQLSDEVFDETIEYLFDHITSLMEVDYE